MCGIIGIYKKKYEEKDYSFLKNSMEFLFKQTEVRGQDTSGFFVKNSFLKKKFLFKRNIKASNLFLEKDYDSFIKDALKGNDDFISILGHCRMQTNGDFSNDNNNQPIYKNGTVCIHNGIITNIDKLWKRFSSFSKKYDTDSEIICDFFNGEKIISKSLEDIYNSIIGETSIGIMPESSDNLIFATNVGSTYYLYNKKMDIFVLSSEKIILKRYKEKFKEYFSDCEVLKLKPLETIIIDEKTGEFSLFKIGEFKIVNNETDKYKYVVNSKIYNHDDAIVNVEFKDSERNLLEYDLDKMKNIKRCSKCLLPETFPFIEYDENGVCNYCHNYEKNSYQGEKKLKEIIKKSEKNKFLLTFSGGRDSCYGMHILKNMNVDMLAYTYDWGMVSDLARRNQSRMCGKLGIEHVIVSADIEKKRKNVRKNVMAWLKRPSLGLVPLFMAGDKQYFYYANKVAKENDLDDFIVLCDNPLEVTYFKFGFAGAKPNFVKKKQLFSISFLDQAKMIGYYLKEFALNPSLINSTMWDTFKAYMSYYAIPHNYINLFKYIPWKEENVDKVLLNEYDWEMSSDSKSTWRIGDATAPFYNYIYTTVAGFSENDTFRSNQIREGVISREEGLKLVLRDNFPRYESIKWYLDTIGIDYEYAIKKINGIKKINNN